MTSQNNIPTAEEIREMIGSLDQNLDEKYVREIRDYFEYRSHELEHLKDKAFRKVFIRRLYLHKHALYSWIELDKEVKNLQREKNELVEKNKQLEASQEALEENQRELESRLEEAEAGREANLDAIGVGIKFTAQQKYLPEIESLKTKLNDTSEKLHDFVKWLAEEKVETKKLRAESRTKSERIKEISEELTEERRTKRELYFNTKSLPKTPSKFKILKEKAKTKFQNLIKKTKQRSQELVARIEVKTK